ncbi:MAG TPA: YihY/virulence factor BrkB family protein [Actinobacteria bacterium]|nr:YihY/virulence factor BrkB family protein [Actinomycetota bacterium]
MLAFNYQNLITLFKQTVDGWNRARTFLLGAALSFYAVISLPSILVIVIAVAGIFVDKQEVQDQLVGYASDTLGASAAGVINSVIDSASLSSLSNFSAIVGIGVLIWVAATVFSQMQTALNSIWDVEPEEKGGMLLYIFRRLKAIAIVFIIGIMVLLTFALGAVAAALAELFQDVPAQLTRLMQAGDSLLTLVLFTLILIFTYKVLPQTSIRLRDVLPGAVITAVLYAVGKFLISIYLAKSNLASVYGAASSLVLMLLWVYYSSLIFFGGAVFTRAYHDLHEHTQEVQTEARGIHTRVP